MKEEHLEIRLSILAKEIKLTEKKLASIKRKTDSLFKSLQLLRKKHLIVSLPEYRKIVKELNENNNEFISVLQANRAYNNEYVTLYDILNINECQILEFKREKINEG